MKNQDEKGFTIIELVVVIIIVGILAAFAIPRFINIQTDSNQNATNSVASALSAANAENFAKKNANSSTGSSVANCTDMGSFLPGGLPPGYVITSLAITVGATVTCTVTGPGSATATFQGTGT